VEPEELLEIATRAGAEALGLGHLTGTLAPGMSADLAVVRLSNTGDDPHERLLHPESQPIATMRDGKWIAGSMP
jgi:imidazolonepropionase-like amidohydrolase